ncbi:MAG TPA: hypothetical protein PK771_10470 [Spirochaetota bacterium]|nr:hypothetical protein [Spirochaetota bacterium]
MKKSFMVFAFLSIFFTISAKEMFVVTKVCPLLTEPKSTSNKLSLLKFSDKVNIIKEDGEWFNIKIADKTGFVQKIFLGEKPSLEYKSSAEKVGDMSNLEVRKRASVYSSNAAATRGFTTDNIRDRENVSFKNYDFDSIKWLSDNFSYTDEEIIAFSEKIFN